MIRYSASLLMRKRLPLWTSSLCLAAAAAATPAAAAAFIKPQHHQQQRPAFSTTASSEPPWHIHSSVHLQCDVIETQTRQWVQRVVIGWNLCPFADHPFRSQKLTIPVIRGDDDEVILAFCADEIFARQHTPGTTLVVAPECHPTDFLSFLNLVTALEDFLEDQGMDQDLQIAPFHPLFEFADSQGVSTYTNRSPYPMFHLLRQKEVTKAVNKLNGDSSIVWQRNIDLLEDLEKEMDIETGVAKLVRGEGTEEQEKLLQEVLKRHCLRIGTAGDGKEAEEVVEEERVKIHESEEENLIWNDETREWELKKQ